MSQEEDVNARAVRQRIRFRDRPRRGLDERITARFPAIARYMAARLARMPPSSRLRQRFLARSVSRGFAAIKRGDLEFVLAAFYDPDVEWQGTVGGLDEGSLRRGHQAVIRGFDDYFAVWERLDLRPEEIIDTGDELIVFRARGRPRKGKRGGRRDRHRDNQHPPRGHDRARQELHGPLAGPRSRWARGVAATRFQVGADFGRDLGVLAECSTCLSHARG
jgi:hypothetical protein